jgi:hypothetical protein
MPWGSLRVVGDRGRLTLPLPFIDEASRLAVILGASARTARR